MGQSQTLLSRLLTDVASAVVSTQKELDRHADMPPTDSSVAPLAFIVKQTQLSLLGQLSVQGSDLLTHDREVNFSQVSRVQAGLYGSSGSGTALTSRLSVSIDATEPKHVG
jgi:hypothetical protein